MQLDFWLLITIFILVDLVIFYLVLQAAGKRKLGSQDRAYFEKQMNRISKLPEKDKIMEADKLLDMLMNKRGYQGSLGMKLKSAHKVFTDLDSVWRAHKLRNRLAHELDAKLMPHEVDGAMKAFRQAMRDLGL